MEETSVLVVDDDRRILKLATCFLESEGMDVHCASSGEEALQLVKDKRITLMITDLHMPGMKGIELAERVREMYPDMLILMMTGTICNETQSLAREAGIYKVFAKPVHFLELMKTAREAKLKRVTLTPIPF